MLIKIIIKFIIYAKVTPNKISLKFYFIEPIKQKFLIFGVK